MKAEDKIFKAFYDTKKNELYFNELQELTKMSTSSLQNSLKKMIDKRVLRKIKTKSNTFYHIKDRKVFVIEFLKIAYYKFQNLNIGVRVPLKNLIKQLPNNIYTVILFGSSSKKEEIEGSDIDVLIVCDSDYDFESIRKDINMTSNYPISIFRCTIDEFYENKDQIIIQARKTGFSIYKEQNFYEVVLDELQ